MTKLDIQTKSPLTLASAGPKTLCAGDAQLHRRQRAVRVMMAMMVPSQHEEVDYLNLK